MKIIRDVISVGSDIWKSSKVGHYFSGGAKGLSTATRYGVGAGLGYWAYSDQVGSGGAALYGIAGALPYTAVPFFVAEATDSLLDYGNQVYRKRNKLEFSKPMQDPYNTLHAMKLHNIQSLSRSRASVNRFIGNEAMYYHR